MNITVNIDTVEFSVSGNENQFHIPNTTTARLISPEGEVLNSYQNRHSLEGTNGTHCLNVRTMRSGKTLHIEGSPYAFLYGQNVYTSPIMSNGVIAALKHVVKYYGLNATKEEIKFWKAGNIDLHRVDIAVNFHLTSETEVEKVLAQIKRKLINRRTTIRISQSSIYWTPKDGKEFSLCFYAKGQQIRGQKRYDALDKNKTEKLHDECTTILRVELRLRRSTLCKLGLNQVKNWNENSAQLTFKSFMRKLRFLNVTSGPVTTEELQKLDSRLRPVLALHKAGCNLAQVYHGRTLQRHIKDFKNLGIDLRCPNQEPEETISLTKVLAPSKAMKLPPQWMQDAELVPPLN
jgi:II/X family phage/plasmid replication protein